MKKTRILLPLLLAAVAVIAGCSHVSDNGDLDGKWQLREHYILSPSAQPQAHDVADGGICWSFQLNLLSITSTDIHNGHTNETICRFAYSADRLSLTEAYIHYRDRDSLLADPATTVLESVGIHGNKADYRIASLGHTSLILVSDHDSLVFRKPG